MSCDGLLCAIGLCPTCASAELAVHNELPTDSPAVIGVCPGVRPDVCVPGNGTPLPEVGSPRERDGGGSTPSLVTTSRPALVELTPAPLAPSAAVHAVSAWITPAVREVAAVWNGERDQEDRTRPIVSVPANGADDDSGWSELDSLLEEPEDIAFPDNSLEPATQPMLTRQEAADLLTALLAARMRESLYAFVQGAWPEIEPGNTFEDGPHIRAVCDHVQFQLEERAIALGLMPRPTWWKKMRAQNLLIRIPPRCLKTIIVTICAVAWAWVLWPTMRVLSLSSNPRVTNDAADKCRALIRSAWYQNTFQPPWVIREDKDGLSKFANTAGGWRASRGITSRITGEGADWLIIDDPHDGAEVYSKAKRNEVNNKWRRAVANRVNDPRYAIRTGVMQALHFDDWGQQRLADGWPALVIRMEFEARDAARVSPFGWRDWRTTEGQTLHPRFTPEWVAQEKKDKGPLDWAAQYQQDPAPIDGGIVKESDLCTYDKLPKLEGMCISVDAAFKKTEGGSRVSVTVVGRKGPDRFLVDNDTRPMHMEDTIQAIKAMIGKWPQARHRILIEDKANGSEIIRRMRLEWPNIIAVNPGNNSKTGRLMACQGVFQGRNFYVPEYASWLEDFKYELCTFPNAPKDDQVDSVVQALLDMRMSNDAARARAACEL